MNKIINRLSLARDKIIPESCQDLLIVLMDRLLNIVKEFKNSEKQVI